MQSMSALPVACGRLTGSSCPTSQHATYGNSFGQWRFQLACTPLQQSNMIAGSREADGHVGLMVTWGMVIIGGILVTWGMMVMWG